MEPTLDGVGQFQGMHHQTVQRPDTFIAKCQGVGAIHEGGEPMNVSVITRWFNEAFFAPFFLSHYAWADEIIVLLEKTSTDDSAKIVKKYRNASVEWQ